MVIEIWRKFEGKPMGKLLFNRLFRLKVPYSGSVSPDIQQIGGGRATVGMKDRRGVRNHLDSVHAVALMNLCEMASGLALDSAMPSDARAILTGFKIDFVAKARGELTAYGQAPMGLTSEKKDIEVSAEVKDAKGTVVCKGTALWRVGPKKK